MATLGSNPSFTGWSEWGSNTHSQVCTPIYTMPVDGTVTSVVFYADSYSGSTTFQGIVWNSGGGILGGGSTLSLGAGSASVGGQAWQTSTFDPGMFLAAGTQIYIGWWRTSTGSMLYSYGSGTGYLDGNVSGPSTLSGLTAIGAIGAYINYTPGGGGSSPSVFGENVQGVTATTASCASYVNPGGLPTSYQFEYGTTPSFGSGLTPGNIQYNAGNVPVYGTFVGLIPNTTYYWQVLAANSVAEVGGGTSYFITSALPPSASTNAATSITSTTATLNGSVSDNGLYAAGGPSTSCDFNISTTPSGGTPVGSTPSSFTGSASPYANVTGLTASTTYYYQVAAWSSNGTAYGSWQSFTTSGLPNAPTLTAPVNGNAQNCVTGGVTFSWTYSTGGAAGGQLDYSLQVTPPGYAAYYWTGSAWTTTQTWVSSSAGSVTITAAQWNTLPLVAGTFTWSCANQDANGKGAYATPFTLISEGPPNAPTLGTPASGTYLDLSGTPTFSWTYNPSNATGGQLNWAMRRRVGGGAYVYWNAGTLSWQAGPSVYWNAGAGQSYTFPAASWTDGSTYSWSVATQDAGGQGGFAADFSVVAQAAPTVTVTEPTGTVAQQLPIVGWSATLPSGAAQQAYQVRTFTAAQYGAGGFNPATSAALDDSGVVANANTTYQIATTIAPSTVCRSYVNITETGSESNNFNAYGGYTVTLDLPASPTLTATATQDINSLPGDGAMASFYLPMIQLVAQSALNMVSAVDSSFETGIGSFTGTVCALAQSATKYLDGAYSLRMTANSTTGTMSAASTYYACQPSTQYSAVASFIPGTTSRGVTVGLHWFTSGDVSISTSTGSLVTEATSGVFTQTSVTATSPSNAAYFEVVLTVVSVANAEVHYVDEVGVFPGSGTAWTVGGLLGTAGIVILRSDGVYVRNASPANPTTLPTTTQSVTVNDYEVVPGTGFAYQALVQATEGSNTVQSAYSALASAGIATGLGFWEFDPLNPAASAAPAQPTGWNPSQIIQSTAHPVLGQTTMNLVQYAVQQPDFSATFETFSNATYNAFKALTLLQRTVFVSQPYGEGPYYFNLAPQPGGGGGGSGNTAHSTNLYPSAPGAPVRSVAVTAIGAPRPAV